MAIRFDNSSDRLLRTSNQPATNADWTITFWVYLVSDLNDFSNFMYLGQNNYSGDYLYIGTDANGTTVLIDIAATTDTGTSLATGTWYHIAVVHNDGNSVTVFLDGVSDATVANTPGQNDRWEFGAVGTSNFDRGNIRIANIHRYDGLQLSTTQISQDMRSIKPQFWDNLAAWWPTFPGVGERVRDYGPNGWDFTEGGTLTDEAPPPLSWGSAAAMLIPTIPVSEGPVQVDETYEITFIASRTATAMHEIDFVVSRAEQEQTHEITFIGARTDTATHLIDFVVSQAEQTQTHLIDFVVSQAERTQTHEITFIGSRTDTQTHLIDFVLSQTERTQTHEITFISSRIDTQTHELTFVGSRETTATHLIDFVVSQAEQTQTHEITFISARTDTQTHIIDFILVQPIAQTHIVDFVVSQAEREQTHEITFIGARTDTATHLIDFVVSQAEQTQTHEITFIGARTTTATYLIDFVLSQAERTQTHIIDFVLSQSGRQQTHIIDFLMSSATVTAIHLIDFVVSQAERTQTHEITFIGQRQTAATHVIDFVVTSGIVRFIIIQLKGSHSASIELFGKYDIIESLQGKSEGVIFLQGDIRG